MKIGTSPITNVIYAGKVNKKGLWTSKTDVTETAPSAVAQYLLQTDTCMEFDYMGKKYILKVEKVK